MWFLVFPLWKWMELIDLQQLNTWFYVEFSLEGDQGILPWFCERTEKEKKSLYGSSEEEVGKGDFVTEPTSLGIMSLLLYTHALNTAFRS